MAILQTTGVTGSLSISSSGIRNSGSGSLFNVNGYNGRLLNVVDSLSGSLFSVNTVAGLPVFEVFSNNRIVAGKYNANDFVISGSRVGIGTNRPSAELHVSGSNSTIIIDGIRIGRGAADINTNTVVGRDAFISNTIGYECNAFGYNALKNNTTGKYNSAFGDFALASNSTGERNCGFGTQANRDNQVGNYNCAFGVNALLSNLNSFNCAFGADAMRSNVNGSRNAAFGYKALYQCTSNGNTAIGFNAGFNITTGRNNTCIGSGSFIGSTAANSANSNEMVLGNRNILTLRCNTTSFTAISDQRDKTDIQTLINGLKIIDSVRPVTYKWDRREWYPNGVSDGSKSDTNIQMGFIAQELLEMMEKNNMRYLNLVDESSTECYAVRGNNLFTPLISAVQELHQKVKALEEIVYNKK